MQGQYNRVTAWPVQHYCKQLCSDAAYSFAVALQHLCSDAANSSAVILQLYCSNATTKRSCLPLTKLISKLKQISVNINNTEYYKATSQNKGSKHNTLIHYISKIKQYHAKQLKQSTQRHVCIKTSNY